MWFIRNILMLVLVTLSLLQGTVAFSQCSQIRSKAINPTRNPLAGLVRASRPCDEIIRLDNEDISDGQRSHNYESKAFNARRSMLAGTFGLLSSHLLWTTATNTKITQQAPCWAAPAVQDSLDVENFLRTGIDGGGNMGVSSQAGKSRPETGVVLRDGSDVLQDRGSVLAEILLGAEEDPKAVLASFTSPWPLATGPVFDVECRDAKTGDNAFLAVTPTLKGSSSIEDVPTSFLFERLFNPTGRFSFYGAPTDIKVVKKGIASSIKNKSGSAIRFVEVTFSYLSQSTGAEIPRHAIVAATIPPGANNVVMLVASTSATRWKQSSVQDTIIKTVQSFQAVPAPKTNLKIRAKPRGGSDAALL